MKPVRNLIFVIWLITVTLVLPMNCSQAATKLRVGVIIPLSGPFAVFGNAVKIGLDMGKAAVHDTSLELFYEDSAYDPKQALAAFEKLAAANKIQVAIVMGSPITGAIVPVAEKKKIPVFAWTPSRRVTEGHTGVLRLMSSADAQGSAIADEMKRRDYKDVAVITAANEYCQTVRDGFLKNADPLKLLVKVEVEASDTDFRTLLTKMRAAKVGAIALCMTTPQNSPFANQARQLGVSVPIFGCHMMSSKEILQSAGPALEGAWFIEGASGHEFSRSFMEKSDDTSGLWLAAAHFDLVKLLHKALEENAEPADLMDKFLGQCLEKSGFDKNCVKDENGVKFFDVSLAVTTIEKSQFVRAER